MAAAPKRSDPDEEEVARSPVPRHSFMCRHQLRADGETHGVTMQDEELIAASAVGRRGALMQSEGEVLIRKERGIKRGPRGKTEERRQICRLFFFKLASAILGDFST